MRVYVEITCETCGESENLAIDSPNIFTCLSCGYSECVDVDFDMKGIWKTDRNDNRFRK